jgi:hypothetical protein
VLIRPISEGESQAEGCTELSRALHCKHATAPSDIHHHTKRRTVIDVGLLVSHLYGAVRVMVAQRHHLTSVGALHPSGALPVIYAMPTVHGVDLTGREGCLCVCAQPLLTYLDTVGSVVGTVVAGVEAGRR